MSLLIEMLENADVLRGNEAKRDVIASLPTTRLLELTEQAAELESDVEHAVGSFTHTASHSLGGSPVPCSALNCRLKNAHQLSQFAALYSDRVYIANFLADYRPKFKQVDGLLRKSLFNDVSVIGLLRPLIESGRVVPITARTNVCLHCLAKKALIDQPEKFEAAYKHFAKRYADEVDFVVKCENNNVVVKFKSKRRNGLLEHDLVMNTGRNFSDEWRRIQPNNPLASDKTIILDKTLAKHFGFPEQLAHALFANIAFEFSTSQCMHTGLLTSNPTEVQILEQLSPDIRLQKRNKIIQELLTSVVPFVQEMSPAELIRLREEEEDSFILFRSALAKAADEVKSAGSSVTREIAEALYSDVVAPELSKLNLAVRKARRGMLTNARQSLVGWTAAISFGMYFGLVPESLREAVKALGLGKVLADVTTRLMGESDAESSIRNENMFFLWKVKKNSSRKR